MGSAQTATAISHGKRANYERKLTRELRDAPPLWVRESNLG